MALHALFIISLYFIGLLDLSAIGQLPVPQFPPLGSKWLCSDIQKYFCCDGPEIGVIETVEKIICADVLKVKCPVVTDDICSENKTLSLLLKIPSIFLSKVKNVICCGDQSVELIDCIKKTFCCNVVTVLCCKAVNVTDLASAKKALCSNPCDEKPCENNGTCTYTKDEGIVCLCEDPYFGNNCEKDPCDESPCKNGGTCSFDKEKKQITCVCPDPYFGDRCEFKCCDKQDYDWPEFSNGGKPGTAVNGCNSGKCDLYPARVQAEEGGEYILGKLITAYKACYIAVGDEELKIKKNYQVLNELKGKKINWVKAVSDGPPRCAVVGVPEGQEVYYVGRGTPKEIKVFSTGKVKDDILTTTYKGQVYYNTVSDGFYYAQCLEETK